MNGLPVETMQTAIFYLNSLVHFGAGFSIVSSSLRATTELNNNL